MFSGEKINFTEVNILALNILVAEVEAGYKGEIHSHLTIYCVP